MRYSTALLIMTAAAISQSSAHAQGTQTGTAGIESPRVPGGEKSRGPIAQAGAGTTSGVTTGYSGPQPESSGSTGQIETPPRPDASLCDAYDASVRHACERVVLQKMKE